MLIHFLQLILTIASVYCFSVRTLHERSNAPNPIVNRLADRATQPQTHWRFPSSEARPVYIVFTVIRMADTQLPIDLRAGLLLGQANDRENFRSLEISLNSLNHDIWYPSFWQKQQAVPAGHYNIQTSGIETPGLVSGRHRAWYVHFKLGTTSYSDFDILTPTGDGGRLVQLILRNRFLNRVHSPCRVISEIVQSLDITADPGFTYDHAAEIQRYLRRCQVSFDRSRLSGYIPYILQQRGDLPGPIRKRLFLLHPLGRQSFTIVGNIAESGEQVDTWMNIYDTNYVRAVSGPRQA